MKPTYALLAGLALGGASILPAYSQSTNSNSSNNDQDIETITIAGVATPIARPKIAGSVTVIDNAHIEASGAIHISDLLRTVAGVNIGQTGTSGSLTELRFRGSESNHVLVMVDGVEINDIGQGSLVDFSHIQVANIEKIEILRGPQSALWGSNAIAGIINIITKGNSTGGSSDKANVALGFGNKDTYQASASGAAQFDQLAVNASASTYKTDGENISRNQDSDNERDAYSNTSFNAGLEYTFNKYNRVNINSRFVEYKADADAYNFETGLVGDANNEAKGDQLSLGLNWHFAFGRNLTTTPKYSHLVSLQYNTQDTDNFSNSVFSRSSGGEKIRVLWSSRIRFSSASAINLGLEKTKENFNQRGPTSDDASNQNQSNYTSSVVVSGIQSLASNWDANYSYRFDHNSDFDNARSYRLGAAYALSNNSKLFASYGTAIKNPTFTERFGFFPNSFLGNPDLQPEHQKSVEAGMEANLDNFSYQISVFKAELEDEILGFVFDADSGQFTAQNADTESERQGVELSLQGSVDRFSWQAQYSYLDASEDNVAELRRAKHTGSVNTTFRFTPKHSAYLQVDYNGSKQDRFFPPFPLPSQVVDLKSYWLVSANYVYQLNSQWRANLRLTNAFDHEYEDVVGYNTDGARALAQVTYSWD